MDPLTVFKDFVQSNQLAEVEVDAAEGKVRFADKYSFPASAATAFRRSDTSQYYPLGVVVNYFKLFHQARDAGQQAVAEYIRKFPKREDQVALQDRNVSIYRLPSFQLVKILYAVVLASHVGAVKQQCWSHSTASCQC
jgi:hypothetical protein